MSLSPENKASPSEPDAFAIRMSRYGPPDVLTWEPTALAAPRGSEVRLRTLASGVNYTDLRIRAGDWPIRRARPFPYTPGVEVVGVIEAVGPDASTGLIGQTVVTMMQGLGGVRAERAGGYATHVVVDADTVAVVPASVDPFALAALGLPGVTAWQGLRRLGPLRDRRILITGAAGGVGSAAVSLAAGQGAQVTGVVARLDQDDYVRRLGAETVVVAARGAVPSLRPGSQDGVLDTVGGPLFGACVSALAPAGVLCLVGAVGGAEVAFDAWSLIQPVILTGYSTETLTGEDLREAVAALCTALHAGAIRPPDYEILPLRRAADAHRIMESRTQRGRLLLTP